MTERGASSTAVLVCQGRATAYGRYALGRFSDPVARELLDAADLAVVDRVRAEAQPTRAADRLAYEMVRRTGLTMVPRTIAIDDAIRTHAAGQLVILGAGLDARAYRLAELARTTVYEIDHPASQRDKVRRVAGLAPAAGAVVPVAVDLSSQRLAGPLEEAGFDRQNVSTWVWEGVVPYLTADEVRTTIAQVSELTAAGSRVVINYQARSLPTTVMRKVMRRVLRLSGQPDPLVHEPWRSLWRPEDLRKVLGDNGFAVTSDHNLLALSTDLHLPPDNNHSLRNGRVAVAARR